MKAALRTARRLGQSEGNRAWLSSTSNLQQAAEAAPTVGPLKDLLFMHSDTNLVHPSEHASKACMADPSPGSFPTPPPPPPPFHASCEGCVGKSSCLQVPDAAVNSTEVSEAHRNTLGALQVGTV